jgi:hypothetical protein
MLTLSLRQKELDSLVLNTVGLCLEGGPGRKSARRYVILTGFVIFLSRSEKTAEFLN